MSAFKNPLGKKEGMITEKPKDFLKTLIQLIKYMKSEYVWIIVAVIFTIISVAAMIVMPEISGDASDTIISGVLQKNAYKKVHQAYEKVDGILTRIDDLKEIIDDGLSDPEMSAVFYELTDRDKSVGTLVNLANKTDSPFDEETKEKILALPESTYNVRLRRVIGYVFDGQVRYLPLTQVDMTIGEYVEVLEIEIDYKDLPEEFVSYFLSMKLNDPNGYQIKNDYNNSNTIGEFIELANLESAINISNAYKSIVYETPLKELPSINWEKLVREILKIAILLVIYAVLAYLQGFILAGVSQKVSYNMRKQMNDKINKIPLKYYDKVNTGEVMSFIVNDVDTISTSLNQSLSQVITSVATVIGVLIMMLRSAPILTLITVVVVPISLLMMNLIVKKSQKFFINQQNDISNVNGKVEESFSGHNIIKLFNEEKIQSEDFEELNTKLCNSSKRSQFYSGMMQPISKLIGNLSYVVVCVFGGALAIKGKMTIGQLQAFVQYVRQFNQPINQVSSIFNTIQSTMAAAERVFSFLSEKEEVNQSTCPCVCEKGDVVVDHVSFGYANKEVLHNFSMEGHKGKKIAIVGETGAGKTTIVKLLMKFYDFNEGNIYIDGNSIKDFSQKSIRDNICMVLQDAWLFNGTIMDNIKYGKVCATEEEVKAAAKAANADGFISKLNDGYNYVINSETNNISQGQKQLITIARAILADKQIIILDEATSSVDTKTEEEVQDAMDKLMINKTCFIIAHRLSTIKNADEIYVVEGGQVVESGKHKELLDRRGVYFSLYNAQVT